MYKINMVCRACKREIDDRSFTKTKIITVEHFDKGPWIRFNDVEGTRAKTDDRFSICQQCYKKFFKYLIEEEPEEFHDDRDLLRKMDEYIVGGKENG